MEALEGQVRAHQAQQALSLHKVDMEASIMEVNQECTRFLLQNKMPYVHEKELTDCGHDAFHLHCLKEWISVFSFLLNKL